MDTVNGVPVVGSEHNPQSRDAAAMAERKRAESLGLHTISHSGVAPPLDFSFQDLASMSGTSPLTHSSMRAVCSTPTSSNALTRVLIVLPL